MQKYSSSMVFGSLLLALGFLWFVSDQGWIRISGTLLLAVGVMLVGILLIARAVSR